MKPLMIGLIIFFCLNVTPAISSDVEYQAGSMLSAAIQIVNAHYANIAEEQKQKSLQRDQIRGKCIYKKATCNGGNVILSDKNGIKDRHILIGDSSFVFLNLDPNMTYELNIKFKDKYSKKFPVSVGQNVNLTIEE